MAELFLGLYNTGHVQSRIVSRECAAALLDAVPSFLALAARYCWRSDVLLVAESATASWDQRAQPVRSKGRSTDDNDQLSHGKGVALGGGHAGCDLVDEQLSNFS